MMLADLGITVARSIPAEVWGGLANRTMTLHGGVVRNAAGQIVRHLGDPGSQLGAIGRGLASGNPVGTVSALAAAASGIAGNIQLRNLSQDVQRVLNFTMANTALAGLGLATSIVGFGYLAARIKQVDKKLEEIAKDVKTIKMILQSQQHAQLLRAIDDYRQWSQSPDSGKDRLFRAQGSFAELAYQYKSQLESVTALPELEAAEGYLITACLGNAICLSDLDLFDSSREQLAAHYEDWAKLARAHCTRIMQLDRPGPLLDARYSECLPAQTLIDIIDFARGDRRGVERLDELRQALDKQTLAYMVSGLGTIDNPAIDFVKMLAARDEVLQSFLSHFDFLARKRVAATAFSRAIEYQREKEGVDLLYWSEQVPTPAQAAA